MNEVQVGCATHCIQEQTPRPTGMGVQNPFVYILLFCFNLNEKVINLSSDKLIYLDKFKLFVHTHNDQIIGQYTVPLHTENFFSKYY